MVNFVKHIRGACEAFSADARFRSAHISMYMALFYCWNEKHFDDRFYIFRDEIMQRAHLNSTSTYARCMNDLHNWGYIQYEPTPSKYRRSTVSMRRLDLPTPKNEPVTNPVNGPVDESLYINLSNNINIINQTKGNEPAHSKSDKDDFLKAGDARGAGTSFPVDLKEIIDFFKVHKATPREAEKFFNYFQSNGWRVGGRTPMKDWHAAARNWILNIGRYDPEKVSGPAPGHLQVHNKKNFAEPL